MSETVTVHLSAEVDLDLHGLMIAEKYKRRTTLQQIVIEALQDRYRVPENGTVSD